MDERTRELLLRAEQLLLESRRLHRIADERSKQIAMLLSINDQIAQRASTIHPRPTHKLHTRYNTHHPLTHERFKRR